MLCVLPRLAAWWGGQRGARPAQGSGSKAQGSRSKVGLGQREQGWPGAVGARLGAAGARPGAAGARAACGSGEQGQGQRGQGRPGAAGSVASPGQWGAWPARGSEGKAGWGQREQGPHGAAGSVAGLALLGPLWRREALPPAFTNPTPEHLSIPRFAGVQILPASIVSCSYLWWGRTVRICSPFLILRY